MRSLLLALMFSFQGAWAQSLVSVFPESGSVGVNPDTHLVMTFDEPVTLGTSGCIRVYDVKSRRLADQLDLSVPPGPTDPTPDAPGADYIRQPYNYLAPRATNRDTRPGTPSAYNAPEPQGRYQLTIIGGFTDGFHFYPVMVDGCKATIYLHHNLLDYGREYRVIVDEGVFVGFRGVKGRREWTFRTKDAPPPSDQRVVTVDAQGRGDFSTLQGALDFLPDNLSSEQERRTVRVAAGDYCELVYCRNKSYVTIEGEGREVTLVHYPNNEVFNPHPADIKTNEREGTFPSRRAAVAFDNCHHLQLRGLTFRTDCTGQAEGLLLNGHHNMADGVGVEGSGDALQVNGSTYWNNCHITGLGDTVLGRGPSFFNRCTLRSEHAFMWIRNGQENHGNVFVACTFIGSGRGESYLAKTSTNKQTTYPHQEAVLLNCVLIGVPPEGWSHEHPSLSTAHLWEFNSVDADGHPVDMSRRNLYAKSLDAVADAELIGLYSNANFVLGW